MSLVSNFGKYVESVTINNALFALSSLVVVLADARPTTLLALGSMVLVLIEARPATSRKAPESVPGVRHLQRDVDVVVEL